MVKQALFLVLRNSSSKLFFRILVLPARLLRNSSLTSSTLSSSSSESNWLASEVTLLDKNKEPFLGFTNTDFLLLRDDLLLGNGLLVEEECGVKTADASELAPKASLYLLLTICTRSGLAMSVVNTKSMTIRRKEMKLLDEVEQLPKMTVLRAP
jgi:hypothetical protein